MRSSINEFLLLLIFVVLLGNTGTFAAAAKRNMGIIGDYWSSQERGHCICDYDPICICDQGFCNLQIHGVSHCSCYPGFIGETCSDIDPNYQTHATFSPSQHQQVSADCNNHGYLVDGKCQCKEGHGGYSCAIFLHNCNDQTSLAVWCDLQHGQCSTAHDHLDCLCHDDWTGSDCTIHGKGTTTQETKPTATHSSMYYHCDKNTTYHDLANNRTSDRLDAAACPMTGDHRSHEAFVLDHCPGVQRNSSNWTQGENVGHSCKHIPEYTAVAAFYHGRYATADSVSGVLLGCMDDGFLLGLQQCGGGTRVLTITHEGINLFNADMYFTIK